jgi:hypothetical protein
MSAIRQCDGGCGQLVDALNEDFDVEQTSLVDDIIDPFTGEQWSLFYCIACADKFYPGWKAACHCCHRCICCNRDDWPCCECGGLHE